MSAKVYWFKTLTVTSLTPAKLAPRQSPVDIPPQPEYKSSNANSFFSKARSLSICSANAPF